MRILIGKHCGFCFGVKRAVELAERKAESGTVYTYGNIIHNESVVEELKAKGIIPVSSVSAVSAGDTLIIRAHGVPPEIIRDCAEKGVSVVDATCPFVKRIHHLVEQASAEGRKVFIVGKADHPEVIGILGYAGPDAAVLQTLEDARNTGYVDRGCVVAQTTMFPDRYAEIVEELLELD